MKGHLVCISDTFENIYRYNQKSTPILENSLLSVWQLVGPLAVARQAILQYIHHPSLMDFASKEDCPRWFHQMKAIWKDRDVVFIEGEKSRLGGNDLFDNVKSIRRILCPPRDAFNRYQEILNEAQKLEKTALFLIALGPTATVLAYDLFKSGYQAIDAGHVDVEYEWWRMGAKRKVKLERKYVNEAANGKQVSDAGEFYRKQIIAKIY